MGWGGGSVRGWGPEMRMVVQLLEKFLRVSWTGLWEEDVGGELVMTGWEEAGVSASGQLI